MKRTPVRIIFVLLLACSLVIFSRKSPETGASALQGGEGSEQLAHALRQSRPEAGIIPEKPRHPSATPWKPAAVFAKTGVPALQHPFPRGENARRRYHEPETRDVDPGLSASAPAVLAMTPDDGRLQLLAEEVDEHTLASGRMVFDPSSLDRIIAGKTSRLLSPTLTDEVLALEFTKIITRSANTHTLEGHVIGEDSTSIAQIVYHDGIIHGSVIRYDREQEIEYRILADGHMLVRELDQENMTSGCEQPPEIMASIIEGDDMEHEPDTMAPQDEVITPADTTGWRTVDVVVGYDQEARVADGGYAQIEARIIAAVDRMTAAFANSAIPNAEVMLLGTIEDPDYAYSNSSATNMGAEIAALRTLGDGTLDTVTDFRSQLGADFVSFVILQGRGATAGVASAGIYTVVARTYMTPGRLVFSHELGHCLGCTHAWGDTNTNVDNSRYGWRFKSPASGNKYETIMAYDGGWGGATVPYYSNPGVYHDGARTGAVDGYSVLGDDTADPQFYSKNGNPGFDGTNPALGANNAEVIDIGDASIQAGLGYNSARTTRTVFGVVNPVTVSQWERGTTRTISFNGGDMDDLADIQLYKGGIWQSTIASGLNPATHRNYEWTIPFGLTDGTDYMIRVELDRNGSTLIADSGIFTIFSDPPHVTSHSTTQTPAGIGPVSQLILSFNLPMNPATFSAVDDIVSFKNPVNTSIIGSITGTSWSPDQTQLTISFTPPGQPGSYQLVIGPNIQSSTGIAMDQDLDGNAGESVQDRYTAVFIVPPPLVYFASMDTNPGWTFSANNPADGWEFGQPIGGTGPTDGSTYNTGYGIPDPTSGFSGPNVMGYNLDGDYGRGITSTRWATTPVMDCSQHHNIKLRFKRWLGVYYGSSVYGGAAGDNAYIEVSNNGSTWVPVWHNTNSRATTAAWQDVEYDISAVADGQASVSIRFGMGTTNSSANDDSCGWNIDDLLVYGDYTAPTNDYAAWISGYALGGLTGFNDDPDKDGIRNGVENYFGTNPGFYSAGLVPDAANTSAGVFTFTHPLNGNPAADISASYRWSKDLSAFYYGGDSDPAGTSVIFSQGTPSGAMVDVTATISGTPADKIFFDVEVKQD